MSDIQSSSSSESEDNYHTCDEDDEADVPRAAAPSSSSSDDERDYHHTSEEEEELDVLGAAPVVVVKKETRKLYTRSVTGLDQRVQEMLQSLDQPNTQLVPAAGSQQSNNSLAVAAGRAIRGSTSTTLVQLNVTQQQFGDVTVGKATNINQSFGGCQNISKTATINEGQKGGELSRADLIMKRTISHFQAWNQGMVRTAALDQVLDKLNTGTTWLTIKGNPGEGKTTVGYMTLEELHRCDRQVFEVRSPDEFTEIIDTCSRPVIMLDDVFGNLEFDHAEWLAWKPALSPLLEEREHRSNEKEDKTSKKDVTVILIGRDYVLNTAAVDLGRLSDFLTSDKHVVDMDHSMKRTVEEKREIWESISTSSGVELDKATVGNILQIVVAHGFPHVCRLFTTVYKENTTVNAVDFFKKPMKFLNITISNFFKDTRKLLLFKEMVKGKGKIGLRELRNIDPTYKLTQAANSLVGTYIRIEEDFFVFDHPSIYDSVAFHICSLDPDFVIQQCHLSFIHERLRILFSEDTKPTESSEYSLLVYVDRSYANDLAERFASEISAGNFVQVLSHPAFTDGIFVSNVMSRIKIPLKSLLKPRDIKFSSLNYETQFLFLVPSSKSPELLKYIDNCPDITLGADDEKTVLYGTCTYAASDVLTYLINTRRSLDINTSFGFHNTPLMIAATTGDVKFVHKILSLKPELHTKDGFGRSILYHMCDDRLVSVIARLIDSGVDVNVEGRGNYPLYRACCANQLAVVKLLLEKGARVDVDSIEEACATGNLHMVKLLFEKFNNLTSEDLSDRCLLAATYRCNTDVMLFLIDRGASVNTSCFDLPLLHRAAQMNSVECVDVLLKAGATVNILNKEGDTALHRAAERGSEECVDLLLSAGATVDTSNKKGSTALHRAAGTGHKECVDLLLKAGATVNIQNKEGDTALHRAAGTGHKECVDLLLKAGATVNIQNKEGDTALHRAAGTGHKECVDLLLKAGATVNIQNKEGDTALHRAAGRGSEECVDLLLNAGATVNMQNKEGDTALHREAWRGSKECIGLLLRAGANVNIQNKSGSTALYKAGYAGNNEITDLLQNSGGTLMIQNRKELYRDPMYWWITNGIHNSNLLKLHN